MISPANKSKDFLLPEAPEIDFDDLPILIANEKTDIDTTPVNFSPPRKRRIVVASKFFSLDDYNCVVDLKKFDYNSFFKPYRGVHAARELEYAYNSEKLMRSNAPLYFRLCEIVNFKKADDKTNNSDLNELPEVLWPKKNSDRFEDCENHIVLGKKRFITKLFLLAALNNYITPQTVQVIFNNCVYDIPKQIFCVRCEERLMLIKRTEYDDSGLKLKCSGCKRESSLKQFLKENVTLDNRKTPYAYGCLLMTEPRGKEEQIKTEEPIDSLYISS